jgi:hypothetical protein
MISAVLTFALITAIGEAILLAHLPRKMMLRILGSTSKAMCLHVAMMAVNLWIHWGTITGSMTAVTAFVVSTGVVKAARSWYGFMQENTYYPGFITIRGL